MESCRTERLCASLPRSVFLSERREYNAPEVYGVWLRGEGDAGKGDAGRDGGGEEGVFVGEVVIFLYPFSA